jgi:hypothetical protein
MSSETTRAAQPTCISLVDDTVVDPAAFKYYLGAPCPICYKDLGDKVPRGTDFSVLWTGHNAWTKQRLAAARLHSSRFHETIPIWNACSREEYESET